MFNADKFISEFNNLLDEYLVAWHKDSIIVQGYNAAINNASYYIFVATILYRISKIRSIDEFFEGENDTDRDKIYDLIRQNTVLHEMEGKEPRKSNAARAFLKDFATKSASFMSDAYAIHSYTRLECGADGLSEFEREHMINDIKIYLKKFYE